MMEMVESEEAVRRTEGSREDHCTFFTEAV